MGIVNGAIFHPVRVLLATVLLITSLFAIAPIHAQSLPELEKSAIDKLARFSTNEHATILFSLADYMFSYATQGRVEWIETADLRSSTCGWPHPVMSHDGNYVAFVKGSATVRKHCRIVIFDITNKSRRDLIETSYDPGEIAWSWNDSEIVYYDGGVNAVSVHGGNTRVLLPATRMKIDNQQFGYWVWYPMQWMHNDKDVVVELSTDTPTKEPGTTVAQSMIVFVKDGTPRIIDAGSRLAVSPLTNRIAYYQGNTIVTNNFDGTDRAVVARAPRQLLFIHEEFFSKIVWSPDATKLFFSTIVSEDRRDKLYLLDLKTGSRDLFLSGTSMTIRGWYNPGK